MFTLEMPLHCTRLFCFGCFSLGGRGGVPRVLGSPLGSSRWADIKEVVAFIAVRGLLVAVREICGATRYHTCWRGLPHRQYEICTIRPSRANRAIYWPFENWEGKIWKPLYSFQKIIHLSKLPPKCSKREPQHVPYALPTFWADQISVWMTSFILFCSEFGPPSRVRWALWLLLKLRRYRLRRHWALRS